MANPIPNIVLHPQFVLHNWTETALITEKQKRKYEMTQMLEKFRCLETYTMERVAALKEEKKQQTDEMEQKIQHLNP